MQLLLYFCIKKTRNNTGQYSGFFLGLVKKGKLKMYLAHALLAFSKDKLDTIDKAHVCC